MPALMHPPAAPSGPRLPLVLICSAAGERVSRRHHENGPGAAHDDLFRQVTASREEIGAERRVLAPRDQVRAARLQLQAGDGQVVRQPRFHRSDARPLRVPGEGVQQPGAGRAQRVEIDQGTRGVHRPC